MAPIDEPLDFEIEDPLMASPTPKTKRRKVIELDDLLNDHYKEQRILKKKAKKAKKSNEDDAKARKLYKIVNDCHTQMIKMLTEDDIPLWGQIIFGHQKSPPVLDLKELFNCELLQSYKRKKLSVFFDLNTEEENFLDGLLKNGWLLQLAFTHGFVEDPILSWAFSTLLYSSNEELQISACNFWCKILLSKNEADQSLVRFGWFPTYAHLRDALEVYGYLPDTTNSTALTDVPIDLGCEGPPKNIWSWINVLSACCQFRNVKTVFSASEASDLLSLVISIHLDRRLQSLSLSLNECIQSVIGYFSDSEWDVSCKEVASSVAFRVPKDLNCLRVVECMPGIGTRSKHLRSQMAFQMLVLCFNDEVNDGEEILELLMRTNVKDKNCDFVKLYIYLGLVENWLLSYHTIEDIDIILDLWRKYLRNCFSQITATDWRLYAAKVRDKALYILQKPMH